MKVYIAVDNFADKTEDNPTGRNVVLYTSKPARDVWGICPHWVGVKSPYDVLHLGHDAFPELSWTDEPLEMDMHITPINK